MRSLTIVRLIRDEIDVYVGRQQGSKLGHDFVEAITQLGDIFALLHFDREQHTRLSVEADKEDAGPRSAARPWRSP